MFFLAIIIGFYSYLIFLLGISGNLEVEKIIGVSLAVILFTIIFIHKKIAFKNLNEIFKTKLGTFLIVVIVVQVLVNLVGALGPELSFDALWYHMTIPKIYLLNGEVNYIPGGLFYYSAMPQLAEMLYLVGLALGNEIVVKIIHFIFGLLSLVGIYKFSRRLFSPSLSLIAVVIFYSNLVVAWESITAYIDLVRTFFEILALWAFVIWYERRKNKALYTSAVMVGLGIATKLTAVVSLPIFLLIYSFIEFRTGKDIKKIIINLFLYAMVVLIIPLPWFVFSYINTGNPVYPFFTPVLNNYFTGYISGFFLSPIRFVNDIWGLFMHSSDPISPVYVIFIPFIVVMFKSLRKEIKLILFYVILSVVLWFLTPRSGEARFIMPYLAGFSIIIVEILNVIKTNYLRKLMILTILLVSIVTIFYRGAANFKYLPVILGNQSKEDFLTENLNFEFGDYYDIDGGISKLVSKEDKVLIIGGHNLYYLDFPFVHISYLNPGDKFNFLMTIDSSLPVEFSDWKLIYSNETTNVKLYRPQDL